MQILFDPKVKFANVHSDVLQLYFKLGSHFSLILSSVTSQFLSECSYIISVAKSVWVNFNIVPMSIDINSY